MASGFGPLVKEAIALLDRFNAGSQCLDDFLEDASKDLQSVDPLHKTFILDVVSGCAEFKKVLEVVICVFYSQNGRCLSRGDRSRFVVVCYLTTFALDDLGFQCFSDIVKSLDAKTTQTFLTFFLTNLTTWIQDEWSGIYDAAYVQKHWVEPLLRWRPEIDILVEQLAVKASHGSKMKKTPIQTTKPKEFALTRPKTPCLPVPEPVPLQERCKPVPASTYRAPKELQKIQEIKQKNWQKVEVSLETAHVPKEPPDHQGVLQKAMTEIKDDFESKLKFKSPSSNKTNNWPIKLNSAAILRQGALYDRQVEEELQRIESLAEGAREPSTFLQWQKEMREKDLQAELAKIERRRLEGRISSKEAAVARTRVMERNQRAAQLKKEETTELMRRYAEKRLQEEREVRDLVQQVAEGHKNSKAAKEKIQQFKQTIVKEVSGQSRELLRRALEEAQAELSRRFELIREIRALESLPHVRFRNFDDTETAGHELLGEMSIAELKERLALLKEAQQTEQQEKRKHILVEKRSKRRLLSKQLETIRIHTTALAQAAANRKEERKVQLKSARGGVAQDEAIVALQRKLEEKILECQRLKETESKKVKTSEQGATRAETHGGRSLKEKSWEELELSLERHIQGSSL